MKTLYKIGMLAVAALAFAGCSKEVDNSADQKTGTHTLTFTVQKDFDTRTAVVEGDGVASYVWTEKDDDYFHIYENGVEATEITMALSEDNKIATFKATFANTSATEFTYRATYGSDLAKTEPHNPVVPSNQEPLLNSFDPAADILVSAEDIVLEENAKADENTEFLFKLRRVVSVNKMTLKGLVEGETVKTVVLRSSDSYFVARYKINDGTYNNELRELTLDYNNLEGATVGSDGTFPVYFTTAPVADASFSVTVTTDQHVYTRDNFTSKLTLAVGTFRRFGINLSGYGEEISEGTEYELVEGIADLCSGATYLIVGGETYAMGEQKANNRAAVEVVENDGVITIDNTIDAYPVVIEETDGGYLIKDIKNNGYLYNKATDKNYLLNEAEADEYAVWSIDIDEGVASISNVKNTSRGQMRFNPNNGSPLFAAYATTSTAGSAALALYVDKSTCVELEDPNLSFDGDATINVNWADIEDFTEPTLNNPYNVTVSYSSSNTDVAKVNATTGEVEFIGDGTTVITATSVKTDEYKVGTAQYTLVVTGAPVKYDFTTIAELNSLVDNNSANYSGVLTNAVVSFVPATNTAIIKDATGSIMYYKKDHGLLQGQTFSGELTVAAVKYNGLYSEITGFVEGGEFTGSGTEVAPESVTLAQLSGEYDAWQNAYVQISNLTVVSQSSKNINVTDGTNTYVVYDNTGAISVSANDVITAKGTITKYGTTEELKVWAVTDLTVESTAVATPEITCSSNTVTITCATEGATIYYTIDGNDPTTASALYSTPFAITATVTVKAIAVKSGQANSGIASETCVYSSGSAPDPETITFADLGLENGVKYPDPFDGGNFTITFAGGGNDGKYYTTGSGIRTYGGGTITIASENYNIASIKFVWDGSNAPTSDDADPTGYSTTTKTWTGSANSVVLTRPSGSGHWRLQSVTVTYE